MITVRIFVPTALLDISTNCVLLGQFFVTDSLSSSPHEHAEKVSLSVYICATAPIPTFEEFPIDDISAASQIYVLGIFTAKRSLSSVAKEVACQMTTTSRIFVALTSLTERGYVEVQELRYQGKKLSAVKHCDVILYNPVDFTSLTTGLMKPAETENRSELMDRNWKNDVLRQIHHVFLSSSSSDQLNCITNFFSVKTNSLDYLSTKVIHFVCSFANILKILSQNRVFSVTLLATAYFNLASQLHVRFKQIDILADPLSFRRPVTIRFWNTLLTLAFDFILGISITYALHQLLTATILLDMFFEKTEVIVNILKDLIIWMMGSPAGLKLNFPLNYSLGTFFLFHIYLWQEYLEVIKPLLYVILHIALHTGVFGLTFQLSLLQDLLALATFHIYCFYAYAAKMYFLHVSGLASLWRFFRGKKWNPLRQRVDSCSYDANQLCIGTLSFTMLFFLFPTTFVYYIVFTTLRLLVLVIQGMIHRMIMAINHIQMYSALLFVSNSKQLINGIKLEGPLQNLHRGTLVFEIKGAICSWALSVTVFSPLLNTENEALAWKTFISNLITGRLIYPM